MELQWKWMKTALAVTETSYDGSIFFCFLLLHFPSISLQDRHVMFLVTLHPKSGNYFPYCLCNKYVHTPSWNPCPQWIQWDYFKFITSDLLSCRSEVIIIVQCHVVPQGGASFMFCCDTHTHWPIKKIVLWSVAAGCAVWILQLISLTICSAMYCCRWINDRFDMQNTSCYLFDYFICSFNFQLIIVKMYLKTRDIRNSKVQRIHPSYENNFDKAW